MLAAKPRNEKFSFRQRGYLCKNCGYTTFIFGNDQEATGCPNCNATGLVKEWDNVVTSLTVVTPYTGATVTPPVQENAGTPSASTPATPVIPASIDPNSDAAKQIPLPLGTPSPVSAGTQSSVQTVKDLTLDPI